MNNMRNTSQKTRNSKFIIDDDDLPIGKILSRREVLAVLGTAGGAAFLSACVPLGPGSRPPGPGGNAASADLSAIEEVNEALPTGCIVRPELTEGPLFVEEDLNRSDIRTDPSNGAVSEGIPLELTFRINGLNENDCAPLANLQVDIWHCDAYGVYSDTSQLGMNTVGQKFLRGFQMTDEAGVAQFTTIYPGWYPGRAVHIHFKIRTGDGYDFTSQLFFEDALTSQVFANAPYSERGEPSLRNEDDGIYNQSGGQLLLAIDESDDGYTATFDIALDLT